MGLFDKLFGNKRAAEAEQPSIAKASISAPRAISYDPNLVSSLKRDHGDLVALYQHLAQLQQQGRYEEIRGELVNFKTRFEAHILTENVRFYTYLEQSLMSDGHNAELMRDFRREMNTIARGVVNFVKKYQTAEFNAAERSQFAQDFQDVGGLLSQRIEREESSLYPLYRLD